MSSLTTATMSEQGAGVERAYSATVHLCLREGDKEVVVAGEACGEFVGLDDVQDIGDDLSSDAIYSG